MPFSSAVPVTPGSDGNLKISPTDVSQFIRLEQCGRYLRLHLHERAHGRAFFDEYGVHPQPIPPLLTRSGSAFEEKVERVVRQGQRVHNFALEKGAGRYPVNNDEVAAQARDLPPGEVLFLFQPRLLVPAEGWALRGDADILRLERDEGGCLRCMIVDMKSSDTPKVEHRLQVAFYRVMLAELLAGAGVECAEFRLGILYRGSAIGPEGLTAAELRRLEEHRRLAFDLFGLDDALLEIVSDPDAYVDSVRDLVTGQDSTARRLASAPFETIPYALSHKCDGCIYNEFCMKWTAERDDLSLVPHLSGVEKAALRRAGVQTTKDLAALKVPTDGQGLDLAPVPGKEAVVRKIAAERSVGSRLDELVHRARRYRAWRQDPVDFLSFIPSKGHGSLPYCDEHHNPNLVRVYIDAQHDYLLDRIYMLGALVSAAEDGVEKPERRRSIVHITEGPPDSAEKEEALFVRWIDDVLRAVVELAAPDENGQPKAPIHLIFYNRYEQRVILDGLGRHLPTILGATPMYDFITQNAAFDSPVATFLDDEIRELKNYPMVCQSLQAVAAFLKFDWRSPEDYRSIFRERMFDFWGRLEEGSQPEGEQPWYTSRARFKSDVPLEHAYAAWGELAPPREDETDPLEPYRRSTEDLLTGFEARRLEAMEHVARNFRGNHLTQKSTFLLPDLASFEDQAQTLARALLEFVIIERHVDLAAWKSTRNMAPERRVLTGETLIARYVEADQNPESAARNREALRRYDLRERYEREYSNANPGAPKAELSKEQKKETEWSLEGARFILRLETAGTDADLEEILGLSTLSDGERVLLFPRWTIDSRLPESERTLNTPTPKQMLYGPRATMLGLKVARDSGERATSARVEVEMTREGGPMLDGFVFPSFGKRPLRDGELYTLDTDPNDIYAYWCRVTADKLRELESQGLGDVHALYTRLNMPSREAVPWSEEAAAAQQRFLEGLRLPQYADGGCDFEAGKCEFIAGYGDAPVLMVQGPPGTGKSYSTSYAVLARIQGAMAAGRDFRVFVSCKTHAATDVLLNKIREARDELRRFHLASPDLFALYFDPRLLDIPLYRVAPKHDHQGIIPLVKDGERLKGERKNAEMIAAEKWCVAGAPPGQIYGMVKARWDNKNLFGHYFCDCLVLDEASQMNLPEAMMAALPLHPEGRLIVVGDPRQMPPIVKHDWDSERRRAFQQYKTYRSLFDTLLELSPSPPMIQFAESFRLHADMAEFLRREIYCKDGIPYHSNKHDVLPLHDIEDSFAAAVLSSEHPLVVVVHDEASSQTRNPFEARLVGPVILALAGAYGLDAARGLGVVVPHRAQRADLQNAFPALGVIDEETGALKLSAVDTVERFQGDERLAVLVSATESDRDYLLATGEFLYDPRRLTVALSRAKRKMILVASRSVFSLFSPEEAAFENAQLWKNLLRKTCTIPLWQGEREGVHVEVWGNSLSSP